VTGPSAGAGEVRIRHGRVCAAAVAVLVTFVALLGGVGVLPTGGSTASAATGGASVGEQATLATQHFPDALSESRGQTRPDAPSATAGDTASVDDPDGEALPADTGWGKRVVFDISDQRVWLVDRGDEVRRTYLVSGSLTDNLRPGSYAVYSRSRWAVGVDDSGVMQYFVRFTRGDNAAIGFHSIPTKNGRALQTRAQLGTPQSHGCIRQALPDAIRLWDFAPVGTKVVVTA
jgi:lipoprotein-anchoring transpeptidase ErfK/SrfK